MKVSTRKGLLIALGIFTAIPLVILSPLFVQTLREMRSLTLTFDEYSNSLLSQRFDQSYQHCGEDFRDGTSYDQFVHLHKSLEDTNGQLKSVKRTGYKVRGSGTPMFWRGVLDADFCYEKKTLRFEFVFHKEDGRWVVFKFETL